MKARSLLGSLVFVAASVLNPAYFAGCGTSEEFEFEADDLAALLAKANGGYETQVDDASYRVELDLDPAGQSQGEGNYGGSPWARNAFACGNRQLVASASACETTSAMQLKGDATVMTLYLASGAR